MGREPKKRKKGVGEPIYCFLKACIVLNGLNKSFLQRESIEIQTNQAIVSSKRTLNMLSLRQLSHGNHANKFLPRQRITDSSDTQLSRERLKLIKQGNSTHDQRLNSCYSLSSWPCFARKQQCPGCTSILQSAEWHIQISTIFFLSLQLHQSSGQMTTPAARDVQSIARLSPRLMWLKSFAV